ncbi:hypothetical protein MNBD_GAMMA09-2995 [hydrothermal vent metagenome]|uniref:Outer-membrane lipoprotein LolB n=1 Tax=hydrothermal vent metagenome TaxID=652676 RepID=A0A3B0XB49_9ZZZZ
MKSLRIILLLPVIVWLSACTTALKDEAIDKVDWSSQQKANSQIQRWTISGRISVQNGDDGAQLDYEWKQLNSTDYDIRLQAPLGMATVWINGRANGVSLKTSSGEELFDDDVDKLMLRLNGWSLPVKGLHYWVRGLPSPDSRYTVPQWNENGLPAVILQDGWDINFRKHTLINQQFVLPRKVFVTRAADNTREEVEVRMIIRKWLISND